MNYEGLIIRPPSEAGSLILQVTVGCSHNSCTFCPAYKEKRFRIKSAEEILTDIDQVTAGAAAEVRRVFLCDGDPLMVPNEKLIPVFGRIEEMFPKLRRVGIYGNAKSILEKSMKELLALKEKKLGIIYMGLESGDDATLEKVKKGVTAEQMVAAAEKVRQAGIKLNVTVLLGLGGKERSRDHARETIKVLNRMKPNHVGALTLMLVPGTPLHDSYEKGDFVLPGKLALIEELRTMIAGSELENCLFFSNHASNYYPVKARLSKDRERLVAELDFVISSGDEGLLREEHARGL